MKQIADLAIIDRLEYTDAEIWPISVIGVTKEVDVEREINLSSERRVEQM